MYFKRIKTPGIGHAAYVIAENGVAAIVDPCRDVDRYLDVLRENGLRLRYILETHRQEDFEMGGASLRRMTGAEIVAHDHDVTAHADRRLGDGEEFDLDGGIRFRALHTPGHTPESLCYAVTLTEAPDRPWGVFTGDALFIGDTGRTDLDRANSVERNAATLFDALHEKILPLGDQALVLPAHGAGSACGGNVADRDMSTIGIERYSNMAAVMTRDGFVNYKGSERLARPPYFRLMETVNRDAGRPFDDTPVSWLSPKAFADRSRGGIVVDTRNVEAFAGGHVPGAYSIWLDGVPRFGGWVADEATPIYLIVDGPDALHAARLALGRIGFDNVAGALAGGFNAWRDHGYPIGTIGTISAEELDDRQDEFTILDVRELAEFDEGHIPEAWHIHVGELEAALPKLQLDPGADVAVACSVGHRGSLGASILRRNGHANVYNLLGGMTAWRSADLPAEGNGDAG